MLIVPQDEIALAEKGWADEIRGFEPGSLDRIFGVREAVAPVVASVARELDVAGERIGFEASDAFEPASYVAMHVYGAGKRELIEKALPGARPAGADALLARLKSVKTPREIGWIRAACEIAGQAFTSGVAHVKETTPEAVAAAPFRVPLSAPEPARSDGYVAFMSGLNSAVAFGSYARSSGRPLARGDLVLVHCNSHAGGFWTDITRTFCLGPPDERQRRMYEAVFAARDAALARVRPGAGAADVDRAARDVISERGFGEAFRHPTGHGVGFAAIDHNALPRLHPQSDQVLEVGMVFNIEPGIYLEGRGGMRHCDMVAVTEDGFELLTPFQADPASLVIA